MMETFMNICVCIIMGGAASLVLLAVAMVAMDAIQSFKKP
jgi:hypothetical protein